MNIETISQKNPETIMNSISCPYNEFSVCIASLSSMVLDSQKEEICCNTDNYDECPIFLAKILRKKF